MVLLSLNRERVARVDLHHPTNEVINVGPILVEITLVKILPEACALCLAHKLRLLELTIVLGIKVAVFGCAQLGKTSF